MTGQNDVGAARLELKDLSPDTHRVFLSRRNVKTLLLKLDSRAAQQFTNCAIYKNDNQQMMFAQSLPSILVASVEREHDEPLIDNPPRVVMRRDQLQVLLGELDGGQRLTGGILRPGRECDGYEHIVVFGVDDAIYYTERGAGAVMPQHNPDRFDHRQ